MLRKYNTFRNIGDNIKLGVITAFSAGMVNVISVITFFAFTSNVTGYYAIFAQEISKQNWYQAAVSFMWIGLFFLGNFTSNMSIIHNGSKKRRYLSHAIPLILEMLCLFFVGLYLQFYYNDSLIETEVLVAFLLFAMGLQNGLTASISNFSVKTTHLTGLTTDLGILFSMFTKKEYRSDKNLIDKARLLISILLSYVTGGIFAGMIYNRVENYSFYAVCLVLFLILLYDFYHVTREKYQIKKRTDVKEQYLRRKPSAELS